MRAEAGGQPELVTHAVLGSGRLGQPLHSVPLLQIRDLVPALAVPWDLGHAPTADSRFLLQHPGMLFDPAGFALGSTCLPKYVVREGCDRHVRLKMLSQDDTFVPSQPLRPKIWEDDWDSPAIPPQGLRECEARWTSTGSANAVVRTRSAAAVGLADAEQGRRVRPRLLPARQIFEVNVFRPPLALPASHGDVLAPPACSAPVPWSAVWKRLHDIELDRSHRVLAWQIGRAHV